MADVWFYIVGSTENVMKCIRMGITVLKIVNWGFYGRKLCFTVPLTRCCKTKFPTLKPNDNFEDSYPQIEFNICDSDKISKEIFSEIVKK